MAQKSNKPLLTKKKQRWVRQFKPTVTMRGTPLNFNAGVHSRYRRELERLIRYMTTKTKAELTRFFQTEHAKEWYGTDASVSSQAKILTNQLTAQFEQLFGRKAKPIAESMVDNSAKASKTSLHASLQELSGGLSLSTGILTDDLSDVVSASVTENVGLIKSIPQQYMQNVQGAMMRSITNGNGMQDLVPFLDNQEGTTLRRARLIASDQTKKVYNNINRYRMQSVGLKQFEWLHTSGEQSPRALHLELSGQVFSFDDPPVIDEKTGETGFPGQLINCGCRMIPVIKFNNGNPEDGLSFGDLGGDEEGDDNASDDSA